MNIIPSHDTLKRFLPDKDWYGERRWQRHEV